MGVFSARIAHDLDAKNSRTISQKNGARQMEV